MHFLCIVTVFAYVFSVIPLSFATISVVTPVNAATCDPVSISWQGGTGPYLLSILSAASPDNAIENLGASAAPPFTWNVDVNIGTTVVISVQDSTGDTGRSSPFTITHRGIGLGSPCNTQATGGGGSGTSSVPSGGGDTSDPSAPSGGGDTSDPSVPPSGGGTSDPGTGGGGGGGSASNSSGTDTGTGNSGTTSPQQGGSQGSSEQGGSQATGDPSTGSHRDSSESSSAAAAQNPSPSSSDSSSPTLSDSPSTPIPTSTPSAAAFNFNSASGFPSGFLTNSLGSTTLTFTNTVTGLGGGGQIQPASSVPQSGVPSASITGQQDNGSNNNFSKKNVISGSIIGGIIAAVVCVLLAAFCVLRRCRARRLNAPNRASYPFSQADTEASAPREMVGRSGYPASTFSSWGNHGDLDERTVTPGPAAVDPEVQPSWDVGQGTIESRYQAAFIPGHASSSSIDRNDPSSHQRFRSRGPIPKSMADARHAGPFDSSTALVGEQPYTADANSGPPAQHTFDEIRPQVMPSWGAAHDMMAGRQPIVAGYPPPYTSN